MVSNEKTPLLRNDIDSIINDNDDSGSPTKSFYRKLKNHTTNLKSTIEKSLTKETITTLVVVLLYVVCGVINSVLLKKTMDYFSNYGFFLNQLTNYLYIPIFGSFVAVKIYVKNDIPKESREFPQIKFFIMGALDAITGFLVIIGGISTSGPLQQLLNQAVIPFTMIGSFILLKERYTLIQLGGAFVIICGVVVSLVPSLIGTSSSTNKLFYNVFYLSAMIPYAASNIYKVIGFGAVDMDIWYLQWWDTVYQSIVGTFLFPINNWLPPPATMKFDQILPSLRDGGKCLGGIDSIFPIYSNYTDGSTTLLPDSCGYDKDSIACDNCHNAWILVLVYMSVNVVYNILILMVLKKAGATVFSIANTLRLPLTNIAFSFHFIMGTASTPFSPLSAAGLVIILLGLGGYRVGSVLKQKKLAIESGGVEESKIKVYPFGINGEIVPTRVVRKYIPPKSQIHLRNQFFGKLGISIPESKLKTSNNDSIYSDEP